MKHNCLVYRSFTVIKIIENLIQQCAFIIEKNKRKEANTKLAIKKVNVSWYLKTIKFLSCCKNKLKILT